jgi:cell division protein FtsI/penicillin-binding protein 2
VIIVLCLVVVTVRLIDIQVRRHGQYQHTSKLQLRRTITIPAVRGGIYDRNGAVLAMSVPTKTIIADNFQIPHPVDEAKALAPILGIPADVLSTQLSKHSGYQVLTKDLSLAKAAIVARDHFPGITMVDSSVRHVPNGSLAQSVIGMTNASGEGAAGIEYQNQSILAGTAGSTTLLETPYGVSLPQGGAIRTKASTPGQGLELTIDQPLQYVTEQALGQQIAASGALSGTAIVMDVKTGEILSIANLVSTTPQSGPIPTPLASQNPSPIPGVAQAQNNLAVTQTYEPGSVFKLVTFSAALDSGQINPTTSFDVPM